MPAATSCRILRNATATGTPDEWDIWTADIGRHIADLIILVE
jgi:hypothetical protein